MKKSSKFFLGFTHSSVGIVADHPWQFSPGLNLVIGTKFQVCSTLHSDRFQGGTRPIFGDETETEKLDL